MAIKGSLREASLPDVLQLLSMGKKTGCLAVTHRNNFGYIYFDKGRISYASIVNRRDRIGDLLVKAGSITAEQLHLSPILMCATNSAGGVMGKMIDAQSICIATAATDQVGNEGLIFRKVFWHSVALAALVGVIVMIYAYVFPQFIPHGLTFVR